MTPKDVLKALHLVTISEVAGNVEIERGDNPHKPMPLPNPVPSLTPSHSGTIPKNWHLRIHTSSKHPVTTPTENKSTSQTDPDPRSALIINLSSHPLNEAEIEVLSLGLCPEQEFNTFDTIKDLNLC